MKWKDLTPEELRTIATELRDRAGDMLADRASIREENGGFDLYLGMKCLARRVVREAERRDKALEAAEEKERDGRRG